MKNNLPIGFFDSGVGGLSVYAELRKLMPCENTIYFGDLKNLPYGNKTQDELISFAKAILDFFKEKGVKAVVIACNTSSALAYESIKSLYDFPIFPIIQSCAEVIADMGISKLGVFATSATVLSGAYSREIKKYNSLINVKEIACPNWVSLVEGMSDNFKDVELHLTEMMEFNPDRIVLGCTHYPYLMNELEKFAPKSLFIDPAKIFSKYICDRLSGMKNFGSGDVKEEFYVSANPQNFAKNSLLFYPCKNVKLWNSTCLV